MIIGAAAVLALGAIFVIAQKAGGGHYGKGGHRGMHMMLRALDLTDAQQTQVKAILDESRESVKPVFESMKANREKMKEATKGGAFDEAAVTAIANEQAGLAAKLMVEKQRTRSKIYALLTDEQKAKAVELESKMHDRFKGRMKGRFAEGKGPQGSEF